MFLLAAGCWQLASGLLELDRQLVAGRPVTSRGGHTLAASSSELGARSCTDWLHCNLHRTAARAASAASAGSRWLPLVRGPRVGVVGVGGWRPNRQLTSATTGVSYAHGVSAQGNYVLHAPWGMEHGARPFTISLCPSCAGVSSLCPMCVYVGCGGTRFLCFAAVLLAVPALLLFRQLFRGSLYMGRTGVVLEVAPDLYPQDIPKRGVPTTNWPKKNPSGHRLSQTC